jgi:hypothetical protein
MGGRRKFAALREMSLVERAGEPFQLVDKAPKHRGKQWPDTPRGATLRGRETINLPGLERALHCPFLFSGIEAPEIGERVMCHALSPSRTAWTIHHGRRASP